MFSRIPKEVRDALRLEDVKFEILLEKKGVG